MSETTSTEPTEWRYGTVRAFLDLERHELAVTVADYLPDPDDATALDPVELDWQAFVGDMISRYGAMPTLPEPVYVAALNVWAYVIPLAGLN